MGMPYDAERVGQLRNMLRGGAKKKLSAGLKARRKQGQRWRRRRIGQNEGRQRLGSAGGILPQLSPCVIQCLGSLQYRLGQEYPKI